MKQKEGLQNIESLILPLFDQTKFGNMFAPYLKPFETLQTIVRLSDLSDYNILVEGDQAKPIDEAQQKAQESLIEHEAGAQAVGPEAAAAKAAKDRGMAAKAAGEGEANVAQAGLFSAQAGAIPGTPEAPEGGVPEPAQPGGLQ